MSLVDKVRSLECGDSFVDTIKGEPYVFIKQDDGAVLYSTCRACFSEGENLDKMSVVRLPNDTLLIFEPAPEEKFYTEKKRGTAEFNAIPVVVYETIFTRGGIGVFDKFAWQKFDEYSDEQPLNDVSVQSMREFNLNSSVEDILSGITVAPRQNNEPSLKNDEYDSNFLLYLEKEELFICALVGAGIVMGAVGAVAGLYKVAKWLRRK